MVNIHNKKKISALSLSQVKFKFIKNVTHKMSSTQS